MTEQDDPLLALQARLDRLATEVRTELPARARALREAAAELEVDEPKSRATLQRLAHMVRGSAGSHGMHALTDPAAQVETEARSLDRAALRLLVMSLADRLDEEARSAPPPPPKSIPPSAAPPTRSVIAKPLEGRRAIALDDDASTRRLVSMTLSNLGGAATRVEESPDAFFAALGTERFDVVVVDAMMPALSGKDCLERIAGSPLHHEGARYFVLSAATPEELGWTLPSTLRITWLRKPFRPRELLDAIRAALA